MGRRPKLEPTEGEVLEQSEDLLESNGTPARGTGRKITTPSTLEGGIYFNPPSANTKRFSSGCTTLDLVLGGEGWALGRIINIVGDKGLGKTLLAIEGSVNFLKQFPKGKVVYIECEQAFDYDYAAMLGLPKERVEFPNDDSKREKPISTIEDLFEVLETEIETHNGEPVLVVVDSLDSLSDAAEMERGISESSFGGSKAKKISELFRRLNQNLAKKDFCVIFISQVRDNIGAMFGKKHTRSGGKALDFYCSQIIWLSNLGKITRDVNKIKRVVAVKIGAKCEKNKAGLPFRECQFPIYFNFGVEDVISGLEFLESSGQEDLLGDRTVKSILKELSSMTPEEYKTTREEVSKLVRQAWAVIEESFAINRKKYG